MHWEALLKGCRFLRAARPAGSGGWVGADVVEAPSFCCHGASSEHSARAARPATTLGEAGDAAEVLRLVSCLAVMDPLLHISYTREHVTYASYIHTCIN